MKLSKSKQTELRSFVSSMLSSGSAPHTLICWKEAEALLAGWKAAGISVPAFITPYLLTVTLADLLEV